LFAGAISSSGVVNTQYEIPEFDTHTLAAAASPCGEAYISAMRKIEAVTESGDDTYIQLFKANSQHIEDFYYFLADTSLMVFQYGSWAEFCRDTLNPAWEQGKDVTELFVNYLNQNYEYAQYDRDDLNKTSGGHFRQWWYQTCTEVAYYQPAAQYNNIRSQKVTTQWHLDICYYDFGLNLSDPTGPTNRYYGALDV